MAQRGFWIPATMIDESNALWRQWLTRHGDQPTKTIAATAEAVYMDEHNVDQDTREDYSADKREAVQKYGEAGYSVTQQGDREALWIKRGKVEHLADAGYDA